MSNEIVLYDPRGNSLTKAVREPEGTAFRIASGGPRLTFARNELRGAEPKNWDHRLYLQMYYQHPWLKAAIDTLVRTATNTGWDFVPRTKLAMVNQSELAVAQEFFSKQRNFMGELVKIYEDLLIFGDAYFYIVPDRRRKPARLKRLAPWTVHINATSSGRIKGYIQKDLLQPSEDAVHFAPHEILHFKMNDPGNDLYGLSPLESLKQSITADLHMLNFQKMFFKNGASMGTFITVEGATDAELERTRDWILEEYVGTDNAYRPVIMGGQGIKIEKGVATHNDMHFIQGRDYFVSEIMAVLGVPPAKLGRMETANRSNAKEQDKSFRQETISPLQNHVENVLNDDFMRPILNLEDTIFEHSKNDIRDAMEQMDLNKIAVTNGINTINEIRERAGYPKIDGGDVAFIMAPTGAVPVDRMDLFFQPPAMNTDTVPVIARSPVSEPAPKLKPSAKVGSPGVNKSLGTGLTESVNAAHMWLTKADDASLRQALTYTYDAQELAPHPLFDQVIETIHKALKIDDEFARQGYVERAQGYIVTLIPEVTEL
jgi:HK97 family phage portal protein